MSDRALWRLLIIFASLGAVSYLFAGFAKIMILLGH
jgi:hypothetical protein